MQQQQQQPPTMPGPQESPYQTATATNSFNPEQEDAAERAQQPQQSPTPLQNAFYNPKQPLSYTGFDVNKFKSLNPVISRHKPLIRKFTRNPIICRRLYSNIFADTIHAYKNIGEINDNYKYILVVIDGLSRRLFARPLVSTKSSETARALDDIFKRMDDRIGHSFFETDQGPEFMGSVEDVLHKHNMTPVFLQGPHKAAPAERVM